MRRMMTITGAGTALLLVVAAGIHAFLPAYVEKSRNQVRHLPPYAVDPAIQTLHRSLFIADLHADSLLWDRDLSKESGYGHVDLPRLQQANVGLQVFSVVSRVPRGHNYARTEQGPDNITLLAMVQGWPPRTWTSLVQRALYQAEKLDRLIERAQGDVLSVRYREDLQRFQGSRDGNQPVGALLALEGAHALEGDLRNLDVLYRAGFRMIGLTHFFDNEAGGSAHGVTRAGLSDFGRELVRRAQDMGVLIDLAHASEQLFDDVLKIAKRPVIVSHTGVRGTCDKGRNLTDVQLQGVARTGGVVGIAMFEPAVCGTTLEATVRAIRYAAEKVGIDHVALGSDFDGSVTTPVDVTGLTLLTAALKKANFTHQDIEKIMGGNVVRLLEATLPVGSAPGG